jgi:hypothetical protein
MPIASRSGTRSATRRNWRPGDRSRSRPGPRSRSRPGPFTQLAAALRALVRFHAAHPDWFPPVKMPVAPPALSPEWEAALNRAYRSSPGVGIPAGDFLTGEKKVQNGLETD